MRPVNGSIPHNPTDCGDTVRGKCQASVKASVSPEWPLDKAQSFLGQGFTPAGVRDGFEDDLAGYFSIAWIVRQSFRSLATAF